MGKKILNDLNEAQRQAVEATEGPVLVIAGAGSGKTRVLTYRVAHLLQNGVDPFRILALTFTNKAAREMRERITSLVSQEQARSVWMGTFHSIFARILRIDGHWMGYPSNYTIYDTDDSKSLLRTLVKEMGLDAKLYAANIVLNRISAAKSNLISAAEYNENPELLAQDKQNARPLLGTIYTAYQSRLFRAAAMDFDDLLFNTNLLLRDHPEILFKYQKKFAYILVDEFQDTNYSQYLITKKLAADNENICVVGDDAQSIYAFRGANIENILNLKNDYPSLQVFKLEQNYRSTKNIVQAANSIIEKNKKQIQKEVWTDNPEGNKIEILKAVSDSEEGVLVADAIFKAKMNFHIKNEDCAILYRTNAQSRSMEEALRKKNIPYRIYGGVSFYQRKEIKDLLAYFRLSINHRDEEALTRIINYPTRGIGKTSLEKLVARAGEINTPLWQLLEDRQQCAAAGIHSGTVNKIVDFVAMIKSFAVKINTLSAYEAAKHITGSTGIMKELHEDRTPEGLSKYQNVEELINAIKDFSEKKIERIAAENEGDVGDLVTLEMFMQDVALLTDADNTDETDTDKVQLMTIHSAKGLEFPYVFIVGVEENLFPGMQALHDRRELEEERRLFYVAVTRAEKHLCLSHAETRYRWGNLTYCEPSRFINDIDPQFLAVATPKFRQQIPSNNGSSGLGIKKTYTPFSTRPLPHPGTPAPQKGSPPIEPSPIEEIQPGCQVEHQRFGSGEVLSVDGVGANKKATVNFHQAGKKQLLLKFAKLHILNK
ncbi:MAG: UvrD-helicase domain-containing protein [Bacteroidales bacterium]|nr:UvrD-helicase domain-containing protein [Bacteroidales bacterium]MDD2323354.1 3'-5' exonuclease [Bacteroidales bacterium]MDD3960573.1 3'-5' exonuclease [Bacteroidales bacterium]MDY0284546.1 3'-5' exonuclease [Bacteroidales bacterium]HPE85828.1 3'-5' exonuclease [Bacteroidales bacterium]